MSIVNEGHLIEILEGEFGEKNTYHYVALKDFSLSEVQASLDTNVTNSKYLEQLREKLVSEKFVKSIEFEVTIDCTGFSFEDYDGLLVNISDAKENTGE